MTDAERYGYPFTALADYTPEPRRFNLTAAREEGWAIRWIELPPSLAAGTYRSRRWAGWQATRDGVIVHADDEQLLLERLLELRERKTP